MSHGLAQSPAAPLSPSSDSHIAIINAGGWGTALAWLLGAAGHEVRLWCRRPELAAEITATRENRAYLPGVILPATVTATSRIDEAVPGARATLLVPISRAMRETARLVAPLLSGPNVLVAHAAKGFEYPSLLRLSQVVAEELGDDYRERIAVVSGPTHAEEVARGQPTACVVACADPVVAAGWQALLHGLTFRVYTSMDVVGVEVCAALKNVVAMVVGAADGLGHGDNARAAVITRSLAEIGRLVQAVGGDLRTVAGLAGLGDVVGTCTSQHSRNRWAGEQLGRGRSLDEIVGSTRQVVEGIPATQAAVHLAAQYSTELPVCTQAYRVLFEHASIREAIIQLMSREATAEV